VKKGAAAACFDDGQINEKEELILFVNNYRVQFKTWRSIQNLEINSKAYKDLPIILFE
jgi:hypothetical protein